MSLPICPQQVHGSVVRVKQESFFGQEAVAIPGSATPYGFGGETYEPARDQARLGAQLERVCDVMKDGQWRTLEDISTVTGDGIAAISARLRDFRKLKFGGHAVNRRYIDRGLFEYRLILRAE